MMWQIPVRLTLYSAAILLCLAAQEHPKSNRCPVIAKLPADLKGTEPPEQRQWFELRQCEGGSVIVYGYAHHQSKPSLTFDTGDGYPVQLVHVLNVLVFQSIGGSADHVYVFTFHTGRPSLALKTATGGHIQVRQAEKSVEVTVPQKTYPNPDGTFPSMPDKLYSFPIEY